MDNRKEDTLLIKHYFGDTPKSNISFDEKRKQAHREANRAFKTRASRMLSDMGFKITDVPIELIAGQANKRFNVE